MREESEELTAIWREGVKGDSVKMEIPVDTLLRLPEGAVYSLRSGRATVRTSVKREKGVRSPIIVVEAGCDSLARELRMLKSANKALSREISTSDVKVYAKEDKSRHKGLKAAFWGLIAGLVSGVIITIKTKRIWQKVY